MQEIKCQSYKEAKEYFDSYEGNDIISISGTNTIVIRTKEEYNPRYEKKKRISSRTSLGVIKDIEGYMSPLGTGYVGSRRERREELKRYGCREVDPSEFKPTYKNERFMEKHGIRNTHEGR